LRIYKHKITDNTG